MQALTVSLALLAGAGAAGIEMGQTRPRSTAPASAASRLREETLHSKALGRTLRYRVLVPEGYGAALRRYPVLYLLHGLTGDYTDWSTRTNLASYSRGLPLVIVMPEGESSWYTNAAADPASRFEDYLAVDLVADVEAKYDAIRSRHGRAIAGLSMGGYGAVKIALKRPAQFMFAASFSGALAAARDPAFGSQRGAAYENLPRIFGPGDSDTRRTNDVYALAAALRPAAAPYVYLDCGTGDGFLDSNRELAAVLRKAGLAYEYHEYPGGHSWDYWDARIRDVLPLLMRKLVAGSRQ